MTAPPSSSSTTSSSTSSSRAPHTDAPASAMDESSSASASTMDDTITKTIERASPPAPGARTPRTSAHDMSLRAGSMLDGVGVDAARARRGHAASASSKEGSKFLPWLPSKPTLEGTLEKKSVEAGFWANVFGQASTKWQLRHFLLYESHLFWGRGFSTMHGYGTVLSAREAPEEGPTAFVVEIMAIPKRSMRRHMQENVDFMQLLSGLCCKPAGFTTKVLRAGSEADKHRWIEALQFGTASSPLSARMPLEFSDEIPPSPRGSIDGTDSERNSFDSAHGARSKKYQEPPPPLSPRFNKHLDDVVEAGDSESDSFDRMEFELQQQQEREKRDNTLGGLSSMGQKSVEDLMHLDSNISSEMRKAMQRIPSVLKRPSSLRISHDDGPRKSVTFDEVLVTEEIEILKSPSKLGLAAAEESGREYKRRTKLLKAAGSFAINANDIVVGKKIGVGSFGAVHCAEWNGTQVAYKSMLDEDLKDSTIREFSEEIRMMRALRHPNIVLFLGAVIQMPRLGIVSELMTRGNLEELLHGEGPMSDSLRSNGLLRRQMAADCVRGMAYLHSLAVPVVHHDLKPANLLVDANWTLKVSDFGMSRLKNYTYASQCNAPGGTPEWMAPEALRGDTLDELSDVYSFGVILWELVTLNYPWRELSSPVQIVAQVAFLHRRLKVPEWVDQPIDELLHACWAREIQDRPTFASIVERLVGEYPSTWSHGETTAEEAAAILSALSIAKADIIEDVREDFVDASDEIVVARVEEFAPHGLARIRAPTPTSDQTARRADYYSSEDSTAESSIENSDEFSGKNEFNSPLPDVDAMQAANQFRPILSPVKSIRSG